MTSDILRALSYYKFRIEFDGTGMVRAVTEDNVATPWAAPLPIVLLEMAAFAVTNGKPGRRKEDASGLGKNTQ